MPNQVWAGNTCMSRLAQVIMILEQIDMIRLEREG